jgi:hypothetical protein
MKTNNNNKIKKTGARLLAAASTSLLLTAIPAVAESIPGAVNDHVPLGTAYNRFSGKFLNFQPIKGEVQQSGNASTNILSAQDQNFRQLSSRLSGDLSVNLNFPTVQASAGASVALASASDEYSSNWVFSVINKSRSQVLRGIDGAPSPVLSTAGQTIADQYTASQLNDVDLLQRVGTDYVSEIEYGSQLFITMKMNFLNSADKQNISGYVNVDYAGGVVNVDGSASSLSQAVQQSVKITVNAHQFGGNPLGLMTILPDNILSCTLEQPQACFELFENGVKYARGLAPYAGIGFKDQVTDISDANVIGYQTSQYDGGTAQMQALVPTYSVTNNSATIEQLESEYAAELDHRDRAQAMLKYYSAQLTSIQRTELANINQAATNNAFALASLADFCRDSYLGSDCSNYIAANCPVTGQSRSCLESYDTNVFDAEFPVARFAPFKSQYATDKCLDIADSNFTNGTNIRMWACNGTVAQKWRYDPLTEQLEGAYGYCLDNTGGTANNTNVHLWICEASNLNQKWYWDEQGRLISRKSGLALDYNFSNENAYQHTPHSGSNQKWTVVDEPEPLSAGNYQIVQVEQDRYLDAYEDSGNDYKAILRDAQNNDSQVWTLSVVDEVAQTYHIQQLVNGRYLDAHDQAGDDYRMVTRDDQNNQSQEWYVVPDNDVPGTWWLIQRNTTRWADAHPQSSNDYQAVSRTQQNNDSQRWKLVPVNAALGKPASQSSNYIGDANRAVDGNTDGTFTAQSVTHTNADLNAWWQVDLQQSYSINDITLFNRTDCCADRLSNFYVFVSGSDMTGRSFDSLKNDPALWQYYHGGTASASVQIATGQSGRFVRVQLAGTNNLSLAEVEVSITP